MRINGKLAYTLFALALLATSYVFANLSSPAAPSSVLAQNEGPSVQQVSPLYLHGQESLASEHMDYEDETPIEPGPIYMDGQGIIDLANPKTTWWHELYPRFSNYYHLSSWIDNGDGVLSASDQIDMTDEVTGKVTWYHVERVTVTIFLRAKPPYTVPEAYLEYRGPYEPIITLPISTFWHEIYPRYSNEFHLSSWFDNGDLYLSPSDQIDITDLATGQVTYWHVERVSTDIELKQKWGPPPPINNPITTRWHELYPVWSRKYHLSSWKDNGDGYLSASDQIDMKDEFGIVRWYHVQRVTYTMFLTRKDVPPGGTATIEYGGTYPDSGLFYEPITSLWHEVYPTYSNKYHLSSWIDNGDRILSPSDQIDMKNLKTGEISNWHVDRISTDIILRRKITTPISTSWLQLYPRFGTRHHIRNWIDSFFDITYRIDGMLSPGDAIIMGEPDLDLKMYNVTEVTITIVVTEKTAQTRRYLDFMGGFSQIDTALANPVTTQWHEISPVFSNEYHLRSWEDNGDGVLSPSDQIELMDSAGLITHYHVDDVTYDTVVQQKPRKMNLHSMEPLDVVHMDREDEDLTPIHVDAESIIDLANPKTTNWHELYPVYSNRYHLSSWIDNGDGVLSASDQIDMTTQPSPGQVSWYHVDRITLTIWLHPKTPGEPERYLEYTDPYEPRITNPISTRWHEVYPDYCRKFHLSSWIDNGDGYLSESDQIDITDQFGRVTYWHVGKVSTDLILTKKPMGDPRTSRWHELYPNFSNRYHLRSWEDNGDGYLSASDQIDMLKDGTTEVTWYHVERVTKTMFLTRKDLPATQTAIESVSDYSPTSPISSYWHEIFPQYSNKYHLSSWEDNGDGILSPSDQIDMTDQYGKVSYWHVDRIATDIILRRKIIDPRTTHWHELYPIYSNEYHLTSWTDNGDGRLSPSDQIDITDAAGDVSWYHVDDVTVTLGLTKKPTTDQVYVDFTGGYSQMYNALINPLTTNWHELYPVYSNSYHLSNWVDNGDGVLSPSDQIELVTPLGSNWYHIDSVSTDITITEKIENHDVAVVDVRPWKRVVGQGFSVRINVTVTNEGDFTETFNTEVYADLAMPIGDEIHIGTIPVVSLLSLETRLYVIMWNTTTTTPKGIYTISAVADVVPGEIDVADNTFIDLTVQVAMVGDVAGGMNPSLPGGGPDGKVDIKDIANMAKLFGVNRGDPRYIPEFDLNCDGKIDIKDIATAAKQFGKIDP